jgi:hypothetical protein
LNYVPWSYLFYGRHTFSQKPIHVVIVKHIAIISPGRIFFCSSEILLKAFFLALAFFCPFCFHRAKLTFDTARSRINAHLKLTKKASQTWKILTKTIL